jgi:ubiquitin-protein ligase
MNVQEMIQGKILDTMAQVIDSVNARIILETIGYPRAQQNITNYDINRLSFWMNVCQSIENGQFSFGNDLQILFDVVIERYPTNPVFSAFQEPPPVPPPDPEPSRPIENDSSENRRVNGGFSYILVQGLTNVTQIIDTAQNIAQDLGQPRDSVGLAFSNPEGVLLSLQNWTTVQASQLSNLMTRNLRNNNNSTSTQCSVSNTEFRDFLISRLFVEGPDQARFEINDVRASTMTGEIAQGIIATQYDDKVFGKDSSGRNRQAVIDKISEDGSTQRLDPEKTLHDNKIQDGDTLGVSPESTAGSIHPQIREEALARVRSQVVNFKNSHSNFKVQANTPNKPTEYLFQFIAKSFAPPSVPGTQPQKNTMEHKVFLVLPPEFPMKAPQAYWQTPIFHPNVSPKTGKVCLGELEDNYKPGLNFGDLCQLLIDIAKYKNYVVSEGYNMDAQEWADTDDGQNAIKSIGGVTILQKIKNIVTPSTRKFQIKRV